MNPNERLLVHLLDCAIWSRTPDAAYVEDVDWEALFMLAQAHKIDAMLLDTVCLLQQDKQPAANVMAAWQENAMLTMMGQAIMTADLHALLAALESGGVRTVVLKGVALKPLYPQPDLRTMSDADLLIEAKDLPPARACLDAQGLALAEEEPGVLIYSNDRGLRVELHTQLFDKTAYGFLSRLDEAAMFPISLSRRGAVYGGEAWVYPPAEHALFMLCHMAKHMITTGFGLRQTTDFILFVHANDDAMDWPAFWQQTQALGLHAFAGALLALGVEYLSLPTGKWTQGAHIDPEAARQLLADLLDAGVFGHRTEERKRSAAVVYRAYDAKDGDSGRLRRAIFPSANTLKAPYLYARRHPVLLPAAWVHRWVNYAIAVITGKTRHADTTASVDLADERLRLLGRLGLRDDS